MAKMSKNIENMNNVDLENICRTCLNKCDVKFIRDHVIAKVFYKLTNIHFRTNDDLPQNICLKCFEKLNEIHNFAFQCIRSHTTLMKCLNNIKELQLNQEQDVEESSDEEEVHGIVINLVKKLSFDKNKCDINEQSNNIVNKKLEGTEGILKKRNKSDENILSHTKEINNDHLMNCSEDETEEQSYSNSVANDLNEDIHLSENSDGDNTEKVKTKSSNSLKSFCRLRIPNAHSDERPFKCDYCSKIFEKFKQLTIHMRSHTGERPYVCKQCSKSFSYSSSLIVHLRTHSGERPYKCNRCPKTFKTTSNLNVHMRIHTSERPYKCKDCSKSFTQLSHLMTHALTHRSERLSKCNQCPKAFIRLTNLNDHMYVHSGERPFKCQVCSKSFSLWMNLKHHLDTRCEERFKCTLCDKSFLYSKSLKRHILNKHTSNQSVN